MKKNIFLLFCLISIFSCKSETDKLVQAEFNKMQGTWKVTSFATNVSVNDSLRNTLKKGEVLFNNCVYDKKSFDKNAGCGGDFQINETIYDMSFTYNSISKLYPLRFGPVGLPGQGVTVVLGTEQYRVLQLMNGDWEFVVTDNMLSAKQIKNTALPNIQVIFTATRK